MAAIGPPCVVCGGAGWVNDHELDCPLETLMMSMGIRPTKGDCIYCGAAYEITFLLKPIVQGECTRCYVDRSRGAAFLERLVRTAMRKARAYEATNKRALAREAARDAKRLIAILRSKAWPR